jgi:FimV C-terminal domain
LTVESDGKENIELSDDFETSLDAASSETSVAEDKEEGMDFEFADSAIDLTNEKPVNEIEIPAIDDQFISADGKSEQFELMDEPLEFDEPQEIRSDEEKPESLLKAPELELADINLDLEDSNPPDEKGESPELNDKSEQWQEVETKLDLAKAYQEMDDKEGAKEMLEEVIRDGDAKQKKAAKKMLKSL